MKNLIQVMRAAVISIMAAASLSLSAASPSGTVAGNTISAIGEVISVSTLTGATVADSVTAVTLQPGFCIVRQGSRSAKVIIR